MLLWAATPFELLPNSEAGSAKKGDVRKALEEEDWAELDPYV
jgi:hypothetical protein